MHIVTKYVQLVSNIVQCCCYCWFYALALSVHCTWHIFVQKIVEKSEELLDKLSQQRDTDFRANIMKWNSLPTNQYICHLRSWLQHLLHQKKNLAIFTHFSISSCFVYFCSELFLFYSIRWNFHWMYDPSWWTCSMLYLIGAFFMSSGICPGCRCVYICKWYRFYNLTIRATNMASVSATSSAIIHILDRNDNAPYFTQQLYKGEISESAPIASLILAVNDTLKMDQRYVSNSIARTCNGTFCWC